MRIPKYQWLMQEPNQSCGFCDEVAVTSEFDKNFQLIADVIDNPELYPDGDYEYNPFNPITTDDLLFDITTLPNDSEYFTLYINNDIIIFQRSNVNANVTIGNVTIIKVIAIDLTSYLTRLLDEFSYYLDTFSLIVF